MRYKDGAVYVGSFKHDLRDGYGEYTKDGVKYKGDYEGDMRNGNGREWMVVRKKE